MKNKSYKNNASRTKEIFEDVVDKLKSIIDSGEYERFLKFNNNFKDYSFNNLILIFSQFPQATKVAGKAKWLKMNREPVNGAKKIFIIAPIPRKFEKTIKIIENGEELEKNEIIEYNNYRYVYVYDISQTEGQPIPLQNRVINCDDMAYFYEKLKDFSDYPVLEEELLGSAKGYYNPINKNIVIKKTLSANDKASVLLHELSHAMYDDFDYKTDRDLSEVFVESIAYIVADYFGLDTSLCSFNYIIKWAKGEPKVVLELGSKIQKCANEFIEKLQNFDIEKMEKAI